MDRRCKLYRIPANRSDYSLCINRSVVLEYVVRKTNYYRVGRSAAPAPHAENLRASSRPFVALSAPPSTHAATTRSVVLLCYSSIEVGFLHLATKDRRSTLDPGAGWC
jgi:hypothetical protein